VHENLGRKTLRARKYKVREN